MHSNNTKPNSVVNELVIRGRKPNTSIGFIAQFYLAVIKNIRLIFPHSFIMKIQIEQELQQIVFNH